MIRERVVPSAKLGARPRQRIGIRQIPKLEFHDAPALELLGLNLDRLLGQREIPMNSQKIARPKRVWD